MRGMESFGGGPDRHPEGEPGLDNIERHRLLADLANRRSVEVAKAATGEVVNNPELHALLSKLAESGPALDSRHRDHLRRMVAVHWNYVTLRDEAIAQSYRAEFHDFMAQEFQTEIDGLNRAVAEASQKTPPDEALIEHLPDLWSEAAYDLYWFGEEGRATEEGN